MLIGRMRVSESEVSQYWICTAVIARHWDDLLRLAGSLKLERVPASGIMQTAPERRPADPPGAGTRRIWSHRQNAAYPHRSR